MKLGGWLPSLHPGGRRPKLPGRTALSQWWNENMMTKKSGYSNKKGYHPWFDEHAFNTAAHVGEDEGFKWNFPLINKMKNLISSSRVSLPRTIATQPKEKPIRFDKNQYPIYQKQSKKAQSFRDAFRNARKQGLSEFGWDGRVYTTELKK